ncbi:MAG: hypothetical protein KGL39_54470 [Patescibacteria group bacterium]|nr:hypothetical protein [Patescibacteria group bacterium]
MTSDKSTLTADERAQRDELERVIESGIQSFVFVGSALLTISEKRLYRETHGSFEPYCREKWNMSARRAYQLCDAARVITTVNNCSQITNECQARELAKVEPARRDEVLAKAGPNPTAKKIREARRMVEPVAKASSADITSDPVISEKLDIFNGIDLSKLDASESLPPVEERVTYWYERLEQFVHECFEKANEKQLASMGVYAALLPRMIKNEIEKRKGSLEVAA